MENYKDLAKSYGQDLKKATEKYKTLRDLDLFVLDNTIRESTVGQLRGHTIENKWKIYEEIKQCGFGNYIVASFNHMTRVDDVFLRQLVDRGENRDGLWAFSEVTEGKLQIRILVAINFICLGFYAESTVFQLFYCDSSQIHVSWTILTSTRIASRSAIPIILSAEGESHYSLILMKLSQNACQDEILEEFENGACSVRNYVNRSNH